MPGIHFQNETARFLTLAALAILGFPLLLWLIGHFGGCVASSTASYCERIPDFFGSLIFAFYVFLAFGGWAISVLLLVAAVAMLILAVRLEVSARRDRRR
ncbi:hypothetical protein [Acidimangrovimonas pyrenivorans]|uniref:Transmembrane protein n=1 Tax=Acidimangrovimonas pyrenivorans TaxID=2030798 RepID=A0ABV7AKM8_9RHOB